MFGQEVFNFMAFCMDNGLCIAISFGPNLLYSIVKQWTKIEGTKKKKKKKLFTVILVFNLLLYFFFFNKRSSTTFGYCSDFRHG